MKEVNQIIHLTKSIDVIKSILVNGFYTSYANENFEGNNVLIPMISFANILFRDIGESEVVNYGKYGIVFDRDDIIDKFELNPVFYVKNGSEIEKIFSYNFQTSIIPQALYSAKILSSDDSIKGKFSDYIRINPMSNEVKNLFDSVDKHVNDSLIESIKKIFEKYYVNTLKQMLLLKPYKIKNKQGEVKIAYNEREWRKSFTELHYISEYDPKGNLNKAFEFWTKRPKPHYTKEFILDFDRNDIKCIYVENEEEVLELKHFVSSTLNMDMDIYTLKALQHSENM